MDSILFKKSTHVSSENFVTFVQEKKFQIGKKTFLTYPIWPKNLLDSDQKNIPELFCHKKCCSVP